ncbi:MAG: stage II sporulation protein M [Chloroflexi bacterium]|nr:MAG: stage II sporulation protein M [Chloroflexota bacterium]
MTVDAFIAERRARWAELENAVKHARRGRLRALPASELERFGLLLRHASSDLAIARREFPDAAITEYLNTLCARAHPLLYRGAPLRLSTVTHFYATGLPRAFRAAWPYIVASLGLLALGFLAGWIAIDVRPDLRASLVPPSLFDEMARGHIQANVPDAPFAASFIIQNNIRVALICFAGGVLIGIPTAFVLLSNGWMLGTVAAAVHLGGYDLQFWSLIVPHGVIELSVIVIAGGTGLMLGDAALRPRQLRRGDALAAAARRAVTLAVGAATLLIIAGTLEAFASPSGLPDAVKLTIGAVAGALLYSWLLLAGRVDWMSWRSSASRRAGTATASSRRSASPSALAPNAADPSR